MGQIEHGVKYLGNGECYEGELLGDCMEGNGTLFLSDGKYEGEFHDNMFNGKGTLSLDTDIGLLFDNRKYDLSEKYIGTWKDGKKNGHFVHMIGGLPYDEEYEEDKAVASYLQYDIPAGDLLCNTGSIKCFYGGQSAFIIETERETLVFDWYRRSIPSLNSNKPVYIFASHVHGDHFHFRILRLTKYYDVRGIYIGYDQSNAETLGMFDNMAPEYEELISFFNGEQLLQTEYGFVKSLCSTDLGVAFIVKVGNRVFYHAGDLFCRSKCTFGNYKKTNTSVMSFSNNDKQLLEDFYNQIDSNENIFYKYTEPLRNVGTIDYAMLPLDPRWADYGIRTVNHYLNIANIRYFSPMHLWEQWDYVSDLIRANPSVADKMISVNPDGMQIKQTIELNKPYFVDFDDAKVIDIIHN